MAPPYREIDACRACGSSGLEPIIAFGALPLADRLVSAEESVGEEPRVPLTAVFCPDCALLQVRETVRRELLFNERYPYYSSVSPALREHFSAYAAGLLPELAAGSFVVEAASNDGCLLGHFAAAGMRCLGVEPSAGPAGEAERAGLPTMRAFFDRGVAREILAAHGPCDLFLANNVLAHVADLEGFVRGMRLLLRDGGEAVLEVPHVVSLVEGLEFDTIYHQHLCYFSLRALERLFARHGLALCDALPVPIHGGSLRLTVRHAGERSRRLDELLRDEGARGACDAAYYRAFAARVEILRDRLAALLGQCRATGRIAGYGAAAKACTMLNYCGIDDRLLDYVADLNPRKHGLRMGGNRLPIVPVGRLREEPPEFVLLLAWNFAGEIMAQLGDLALRGTRFIIPVPEPRIVGPMDGGAR